MVHTVLLYCLMKFLLYVVQDGAKSVTLIFGQTPSKKQIDHLSRLLSITTMPNMAPHTGGSKSFLKGISFYFHAPQL